MRTRLFALVAGAAIIAAACSSGSGASAGASGGTGGGTKVRFQLQWVAQAQFAGYYAAQDQGYYKDEGLDVSFILGGPNIDNVQAVAAGNADIGTAWLPNMLRSREGGTDLVSIAQVFQRSGTRMASFKDKAITAPANFAGKKVGSWLGGNEPELFASMVKAGLDPTKENVIKQNFDMSGLLNGDLDVAQAMIYNEYAQVLEAKNPDTGQLYTPDDFAVINWNDVGTAMLQDAIWANTEKLNSDAEYKDTATKFVTASMKGWMYCRDNPQDCVDIVLAKGSKLGASHQLWQMNEINKLIWPSANGVGNIDDKAWTQTVDVALNTKNAEGTTVITKQPDKDAYTNAIADAARDQLKDEDTTGSGFKPLTVTLNEGGA